MDYHTIFECSRSHDPLQRGSEVLWNDVVLADADYDGSDADGSTADGLGEVSVLPMEAMYEN